MTPWYFVLPHYHLKNNNISNISSTQRVTIIQISLEEQISTYCIIVSHGQWISSYLWKVVTVTLARSIFSSSTRKRKAVSSIYMSKHLSIISFYPCMHPPVHLSIHPFTHLPMMGSFPRSGRSLGIGNSNPLQYSCLRNPTDRGVWQSTVHGATQSWTWLSD